MNIVPLLLISSFLYFSIILTIPASIFGKEISKDFDTTIHNEKNFDLSITDEDAISLKANNSSLLSIINELATQMNFEVLSHLPDDITVTGKYDNINIDDLLRSLREYSDIVYVKDSQKGKVTKVFLFSKLARDDYKNSVIKEYTNSKSHIVGNNREDRSQKTIYEEKINAEPHKFTFDPSKYLKE